LIDFQQDCSYY